MSSPTDIETDLRKKCSRPECRRAGQWLPLDQFYTAPQTLASGEVKRYPKGACKECERARVQQWRDQVKDVLGLDYYKELCKRYNRPDSETRKEYNRRWQREKSGKDGPTWHKYRHEVSISDHQRVPAEPFRLWWATLPAPLKTEINKDPNLARAVYRITHSAQKWMIVRVLDQVGEAIGDPGMRFRLTD